jgi:cytochrome c-type biogenesis protein CcmH/NrfG
MTPPKKKTSPWVWILGGCGVLVVLIVLALVATSLFIAKKAKDAGLDPDLMKKNPRSRSQK